MKKIGTHDSATGEEGAGLLSWLTTPFARTQSKTICGQLLSGCTLFDIRVKRYNGEWHCAHGTWHSKRTVYDILDNIDVWAFYHSILIGVTITYEGRAKDNDSLLDKVKEWKERFSSISFGPVAVKYGKDANGIKVKYDYILEADKDFVGFGGVQGFLPLDGRSWHTYMPIPWLWDRLYKRPHVFNEDTYTYVDFL